MLHQIRCGNDIGRRNEKIDITKMDSKNSNECNTDNGILKSSCYYLSFKNKNQYDKMNFINELWRRFCTFCHILDVK